jgi:hypothetical protein
MSAHTKEVMPIVHRNGKRAGARQGTTPMPVTQR